MSYKGTLGWIELSDHNIPFDSPGIQLCGGNFAIKKSVFNDIGLFKTNLGRSAGNLMGGEDGDFHRRLKENHKKGLYSPSLIIYHQIPISRMTFKYHIRWAFWSGVSNGVRIKSQPDTKEDVAHLFDIPKYWYNKSIKGILQFIIETSLINIKSSPRGICGIMDFCYFFGLLYGRYFYSQK